MVTAQELSQWPHYYWNLCKHLGVECYRTWRWELFASVLVTIFVAVLTRNWKDFSTALLATGLTLACFAIGHILRTPFLLHKSLIAENPPEPHFMAGIFGIAVLAAVLVFGYELGLNLWSARPLGEIVANFPEPRVQVPQVASSRPKTTVVTSRPSRIFEVEAREAGNLTVKHGAGCKPSRVSWEMTSGGNFWLQKPVSYDQTNIYFVASGDGITARVLVWCQ